MHCHHCSSLMAETENLQNGSIEQTRFECPVCGLAELVTQRLRPTQSLSGAQSTLAGNMSNLHKLGYR